MLSHGQIIVLKLTLLTFKSDVGDYKYDENSLITSAGDDLLTHTALGQMKDTPLGEYAYDLNGYLKSVTKDMGVFSGWLL